MSDDRSENLRQRAREILQGKPIEIGDMSRDDVKRLIFELQIHQVELQLQNEELRSTQQQLELSRQKYADLYDFAPVGYLTLKKTGFAEEVNLTLTALLNTSRQNLFKWPFISFVVPMYRHVFSDHIKRLSETQQPQRDELQLMNGNGEHFYAQLNSRMGLPDEDESMYYMTIEDVDRRKQIENAEFEERLFSESLRVISIALNSTLDLDEVLSLILRNISYVVQHDVAEVILFNGNSAKIVGSQGYTANELEETIRPVEIPIDKTHNLSQIVQVGEPIIIANIQQEPRWFRVIKKDLHSYIGVPIRLDKNVIGCLNVFNKIPDYYTEKYAERLQAFAGQTATALKNAQLYQQSQEAAVLQERHRLARDLHDAVSQSLFSATIIAEAIPRIIDRDPSSLAKNLDDLTHLVRGAMAEMRILLLELRPETLERYSLSELLHQLALGMEGRKPISVEVKIDGKTDPQAEVKEVIYRISQEALNNIIKHSQAKHVSIYAESTPDHVRLIINDNGKGFNVQNILPGIGLKSMYERAKMINAQLNVESTVGEGSRITLEWEKTFQ